MNNMGCNIDNTCVGYFSLKDGEKINDARFCESMKSVSNYCASTTRVEENAECVADEKTQQQFCMYKVVGAPEEQTKEECRCSRGYSDKKFCPLGSTENAWTDMVKSLKEFYNGAALKLHTIRRNVIGYSLKTKVLPALSYPLYEYADKCALDIDAANSYIQISLGYVIGILLLLI